MCLGGILPSGDAFSDPFVFLTTTVAISPSTAVTTVIAGTGADGSGGGVSSHQKQLLFDRITSLNNSFSGRTLVVFNHLMYCTGLYNDRNAFQPVVQQELSRHTAFPIVTVEMKRSARSSVVNGWLADYVQSHKLVRNPRTVEQEAAESHGRYELVKVEDAAAANSNNSRNKMLKWLGFT